jgi:magnesium chelatase subunit I
MTQPFPFSAIVGQDEMKQSLLLAAIDPTIGGVLVFGDRGAGWGTGLPPVLCWRACWQGSSCCWHCAGR